MIRWLKRISPFIESAVMLGAGFPLFLLFVYCVMRPVDNGFLDIQGILIVGYCAAGGLFYGTLRVNHFHPHANEQMRKWLATTPWRWPKPLPLGPVELVPQDALAVIAATLWAIVVAGNFWPLFLFTICAAVAYTLALAGIASSTDVPWADFGVSAALAAALAFAVTPWLSAVFVFVSYLIARQGNRQSLQRFHEWSDQLESEDRIPADWIWTGKNAKGSLGWPHSMLSPQSTGPLESRSEVVDVTLLLGIWTWALCHLAGSAIRAIPVEEMDFSVIRWPLFYLIPALLGVGLAMIRLQRYLPAVSPALRLSGRIIHRRLLLPGYDQVYLAPLLLVFLGAVLSLAGNMLSIPLEVFLPISVTGLTYLALAAGPTLEEWRLTANGNVRYPHLRDTQRFMVTQ